MQMRANTILSQRISRSALPDAKAAAGFRNAVLSLLRQKPDYFDELRPKIGNAIAASGLSFGQRRVVHREIADSLQGSEIADEMFLAYTRFADMGFYLRESETEDLGLIHRRAYEFDGKASSAVFSLLEGHDSRSLVGRLRDYSWMVHLSRVKPDGRLNEYIGFQRQNLEDYHKMLRMAGLLGWFSSGLKVVRFYSIDWGPTLGGERYSDFLHLVPSRLFDSSTKDAFARYSKCYFDIYRAIGEDRGQVLELLDRIEEASSKEKE